MNKAALFEDFFGKGRQQKMAVHSPGYELRVSSVSTSAYIYTHVSTYINTYIHIYIHTHIYICVYKCMRFIYIYIFLLGNFFCGMDGAGPEGRYVYGG